LTAITGDKLELLVLSLLMCYWLCKGNYRRTIRCCMISAFVWAVTAVAFNWGLVASGLAQVAVLLGVLIYVIFHTGFDE